MSFAESQRMYFWEEMNKAVIERGRPFNVRKASTDNWYNVAIGRSDANIQINLVNKSNSIIVDFYIVDSKELFDFLYSEKDKIEKTAEMSFKWQRLDNKKASRIQSIIKGLDFNDHKNYPELINQVIDRVIRMREVFKEYC